MVIGLSGVQFDLYSYEYDTNSNGSKEGVRFVNHEYDYRQNWTTGSLIININIPISKDIREEKQLVMVSGVNCFNK